MRYGAEYLFIASDQIVWFGLTAVLWSKNADGCKVRDV